MNDDEDDVLAYAYNAAHSLLSVTSLVVTTTWGFAVDAVGVDRSTGDKWAAAWERVPATFRSLVHWRFLDLAFGSSSNETPIIDPTATEDYTRWSHSIEVLPTTKRVVDVFSLYRWLAGNSCNPSTHREWRTVVNVRDSNMSLISGIPEKINGNDGCSYSGYHTGQAGWGEELPDVSASWFLSDFFVLTWYDRTTCTVYARMFNSNGAPITSRITVDNAADPTCSSGAGALISPRVEAFPSGFVVVWTRNNGSVWLRTFDITGTALITPRAIPGTQWKGINVDVDGTYATVCAGEDPQVYFTVTWWAAYLQPSGGYNWYPQMLVYQNLSDPQTLYPGWGYVPIDSKAQKEPGTNSDAVWDRVSVEYFSGLGTQSCNDLTMGLTWTVADKVTNTYDEVRKAFYRFTPQCGTGFAERGTSVADPFESLSEADASASDVGGFPCADGECSFVPPTRPVDEPQVLLPAGANANEIE